MIIPFMKAKWITTPLSIFGLVYLFFYTYNEYQGFKQGLDFSGGLNLEITVNELITVESLRSFFKEKKMKTNIILVGKNENKAAKIEIDARSDTLLGKEAEKRSTEMSAAGLSVNSVDYLKYLLIQRFSPRSADKIQILNADKVGPTVGDLLRKSSLRLLLITLILITFYVAFRFHFTFAMGATTALLHDLLITMGLIGYLQIPLSIPVVAALLTILGYSINDTIVIFDRIRENLHHRETMGFERVINQSITQSISRTLITSVTTLLAVFSVYLYGGEGLKEMALVLILGIIVGTYSSSFVASPMVMFLDKLRHSRSHS